MELSAVCGQPRARSCGLCGGNNRILAAAWSADGAADPTSWQAQGSLSEVGGWKIRPWQRFSPYLRHRHASAFIWCECSTAW